MELRGRRIFVGLSGGVDSAVTAALLQQAGAQVEGVFIKGWYPPGMPCTWAADRRDAMRVAARLQIPFHTLDASAEYKKSVIDYLLAEYKAGRTPNPDVMCNRDVKFGAFYRYAREAGADFIATGHYARAVREADGAVQLMRGKDENKDQSYFLWAVPKDVLEHTVFPLGELAKPEVRALAKQFDLPVAEKKDSQGVCFLGSVSVKEFLEHELHTSDPTILHTIGERVAGKYVVGKKDGALELAEERAPRSGARELSFRDAHWLTDASSACRDEHGAGRRARSAQYRYRGEALPGRVEGSSFIFDVPLPEPVAPGQSLVFYDEDELVGGGIIES